MMEIILIIIMIHTHNHGHSHRCRAPLDSKLSNYLLAASNDAHDYESTPAKQDYMNTLKESVLLAQGRIYMMYVLRQITRMHSKNLFSYCKV